jgi:carbohydrate-binding DOMON domain-containing protein
MSATLLQLMQQASSEMGLASPTSVIGNTAQDVVQTLALTQAVGYELQRQHQWQALTQEYQFSTAAYTYTGTVTSGSTAITGLSSTTGLTTSPTYFQVTGTGIGRAPTS